jgi:site-specific DNA-methyltransferase (adenine-specific)
MIQLIQGDCLTEMQKIESGSVDAIITDPPYGTTACKWDSVIDFGLMWEQLNRIIKPNGAIVLFGSEPFSSALRMSNIKNYKYDWVWDKVNSGHQLNAKRQPMRIVENIIIFNSKIYYPIMTDDGVEKAKERLAKKAKTTGSKQNETVGDYKQYTRDMYDLDSLRYSYPKNIIKINKSKGECNALHRLHPTQKPVALMEYLIKTYTNENETVLDFTMGSGSTGVAAKNLNRSFIGIEQDPNYFKIAEERINKQDLFTLDTK